MKKKTSHFFTKYRPFAIILSLALVMTIAIGSIRGYAEKDPLGDSTILADETLGNSLGDSGAQVLGASTRTSVITIKAGDPLFLINQTYKTEKDPTLRPLPTDAKIVIEPGVAGENEEVITVEGNVTIERILANDIDVTVDYETENTTFTIKNEHGDNCITANSFVAVGTGIKVNDTIENKLVLIGNSSGSSTEIKLTENLVIGDLNFSSKPNQIQVGDDALDGGEIEFRSSNIDIQVGKHAMTPSAGVMTSRMLLWDNENIKITGSNLLDYTLEVKDLSIHRSKLHVMNGKKAAGHVKQGGFVAEDSELEFKTSAPGSTGFYHEGIDYFSADAQIFSSNLVGEGDYNGLLFYKKGVMFIESDATGKGQISGISGIGLTVFDMSNNPTHVNAILTKNNPNAKGALYLNFLNADEDPETGNHAESRLHLNDTKITATSEENTKKGAAFTIELSDQAHEGVNEIVNLHENASLILEMPSYTNDHTWAFNAILHQKNTNRTKKYNISLDADSKFEIHYTKPVKIELEQMKPYNTNAKFMDYNWKSTPNTVNLITTNNGFESRSKADNGTLTGIPKGATVINPDVEVNLDPSNTGTKNGSFEVIYDDVTYTKNTTLTLKGEGGKFTTNTDTVTKTITKDVAVGALEVPVRTGFEFKGFFTKQNGQGTEYTNATIFTGTRPLTLYAHWSRSNFAVNFVANDGTPSPASQSIAYQGFVKEPAKMTKTGYTFKGWYKEASFNTEWKFATDKMPAKNITLYAKWEINKYKVTFHPNGGAPAPVSQTLNYNALVVEPATMTKTGHTFKGWYQDTGFTQPWNFGTSRVPAKNLNLYAKWEANKYQMDFVSNGGAPTPAPVNVTYNTLAKEPAKMSKAGYTFGGWYKDAGLTQPWNFAKDKMPANNVTLYAQWKEITYTANFDPNGGTPKPASVKVKFGKKMPTPVAVTKIGYNFTNWYKGSSVWNFATDTMPNSDITLKAGWVVDPNVKFKVNFDPNGGTLDYLQKEYPAETVIPVPNGVRPGYILDHWKYGGKTWKVGVDKTPNKDITLIAQWKIDPNQKIQVTFDAKGGAPTPPAQTHMVEDFISKPSNPTRYGYNFTGWIYKDTGKLWNFEKTKIADKNFPGPMIMNATWKPDPNVKFTVTFDPGPLGTVTPTSEQHVAEEKINKPKASRHGYALQGWKKDDGTYWNFKTDRMPAKDITLKADWKFDPTAKVTVEFDTNRGKPTPPNQFVQYGHKVVMPTNVIRPGYNLTGWKLLLDGKIWDFENDTIEQKHFDDKFVLQAQWKVDPAQMITVKFDAQGGKPVPNFQRIIPMEQLLTSPAIPVKHRYEFLGWFTEPEGGKYWNFEKDLAPPAPKEFVLYAHWQRETGPGKSNPDPGYRGDTPMPDTSQGKQQGLGMATDTSTNINGENENAPVLEDTGMGNETATPQNPNPSTGGTKARISGYLHKMTTGDDLTIDGVVVEPLRARDAVVMIAIPVILLAVIVGAIYTFVKKKKKSKN